MKIKPHQIRNFILLGLVLSLLTFIFLYPAIVISLLWIDGSYWLDHLFNVGTVFERYGVLFNYWVENSDKNLGDIPLQLTAPMGALLFIFLVVIFLIRAPLVDFRPFQPKESLHGDAKWASEAQIKAAGLRAKSGVLLGQTGRGYLRVEGYEHSLLFAPTGSGKGVGFVIPNLLTWEESLVVHDIKLENYEITSGWRQKHMKQKVYLWNPASPDGITHAYNPLEFVSNKHGQMVDDVQKMANLLLPEQEFWNNEARSLFVGVALYLLCVPEKTQSLGEVVRVLRSDDVVYNLAVVLDTLGKQIHPSAYMNLAAFLQKADKERSGVLSTLNSSLELWVNPLIDSATAASDFDFNMFKKEKTTVYVGLTPDNIERLKPLMQIFYQQASQILTKHMPRDDEPYGILFMMDEFPTLGEMEQFKNGIAYFRGYHVRLFLIIQDTEQLKDHYEEAGMNSFLSNAKFRITFAANNVETANLISQLVGNKTVKQVSRNSPVFLDLNPASRSKHISEAQRALLLPQEVIGLPRDEQIILVEASPPIKTKKIFYFKDPYFIKKAYNPKQPKKGGPAPIDVPQQEPFDLKLKREKEEAEKKKKEEQERKRKEEEKRKAEQAAKSQPPPRPPTPAQQAPNKGPAQGKTTESGSQPTDAPA